MEKITKRGLCLLFLTGLFAGFLLVLLGLVLAGRERCRFSCGRVLLALVGYDAERALLLLTILLRTILGSGDVRT